MLAVLGFWAAIRLGSDRVWWATVLSFGPRWAVATPVALLAPAAMAFRPRSLVPMLIGAVLVAGPVMGLCLPWRSALGSHEGVNVRVLTCNTGGGTHAETLSQYIRRCEPDIVVLQEWGSARPRPAGLENWHEARGGGLVLTRYPIVHSERLESPELGPWQAPALRCDVETPGGIIHVFCLHLETPREGLEEVLHVGWRGADEMEAVTDVRWTESRLSRQFVDAAEGPTLIAGDFNLPADSGIYRTYWSDFANAFERAGLGWGWTKYTRHFGVRIDHVLTDASWSVRDCRVGPRMGGDHRPVLADLTLREAPQ